MEINYYWLVKNGAVLFDNAADLRWFKCCRKLKQQSKKLKKQDYENKYLIGLLNTTQQPLLVSLKNRATREKIYKSSWYRAEKNDEGDTREVLEKNCQTSFAKSQFDGQEKFCRMEASRSNGANTSTSYGNC